MEKIYGKRLAAMALSAAVIFSGAPQNAAMVWGAGPAILEAADEGQITGASEVGGELLPIGQALFPDESFCNYIREFVDMDGDGALSQAEISSAISMDVSGRGIASLKGIEVFTELEELACSGNHLVELDVTALTNLKNLVCENNRVVATVDADNRFTLPFALPDGIGRVEGLTGASLKEGVFIAASEWASYSFNAGNGFSISVSVQLSEFRKDISNATVQAIPDVDYTGKAIEPKVGLMFQGKEVPRADYTIAYQDNLNAGTAKVIISGTNHFMGTKTATFTIRPKSVSGLPYSKIPNKVYTGKEVKPSITIMDHGRKLKASRDYAITYKDNKQTGKASAIIKGKGNYKGTKRVSFKILPQKVSAFKKVGVSPTSIQLKWKKSASVTGYQIFQYSPKTKKYRQIKKLRANTTSFTVKNLSTCTTYRFKIRAYKKSGNANYYGNYSNVLKVETKLSSPSIKVSSKQKGQAIISWSQVSKASELEISYRKGKGKYKSLNSRLENKKNEIYLYGLAEGEPYTFRIRSYRRKNGKKAYSDYSKKTVAVSSQIDTARGDWAGCLNAAKNASQIVVVAANGISAAVSMHNKNPNGSWEQILFVNGNIGRNGIGKTAEGDGKTPQGIYRFSTAFGIKPNPGTILPYTQADASYYWVDDPRSAYYNRFVSTHNVVRDWRSAEHITGMGSSYHYVLAIDYNAACVPGAGSAIFLHCNPKGGTSGCIAVPESSMVAILQNIQPGCLLIIDSVNGVYGY